MKNKLLNFMDSVFGLGFIAILVLSIIFGLICGYYIQTHKPQPQLTEQCLKICDKLIIQNSTDNAMVVACTLTC